MHLPPLQLSSPLQSPEVWRELAQRIAHCRSLGWQPQLELPAPPPTLAVVPSLAPALPPSALVVVTAASSDPVEPEPPAEEAGCAVLVLVLLPLSLSDAPAADDVAAPAPIDESALLDRPVEPVAVVESSEPDLPALCDSPPQALSQHKGITVASEAQKAILRNIVTHATRLPRNRHSRKTLTGRCAKTSWSETCLVQHTHR